jgi:hypothetical protein
MLHTFEKIIRKDALYSISFQVRSRVFMVLRKIVFRSVPTECSTRWLQVLLMLPVAESPYSSISAVTHQYFY